MYEGFYQLTSNPFRLAPDPNFCFNHSGYKRAREYLEYALEQGEGFVMVTGRPGTGKTMLVETFLSGLDTNTVIAKRIAASNYGADDLLRAVAYAYGFDAADMDKATVRHRIQQYFLQQEQEGRRVLLIIDEAQALQHTALEELRILADLQTQSRQMLQLFLVGQESLQELMSTPEMEQFQQRVIANYHLVPLNLMDSRAYIEYRLLQAGWTGAPEFTSAAVLSIYQLSKGVPRHINKICNRLLLLGFGKGNHVFDRQDVHAISVEMHDEQLTPMEGSRSQFTEGETITSIPEIRDGLFSVADLAIRADKLDADALAISEAARLAAKKKAQFTARHHGDPAARNQQQSSSVNIPDSAAAVSSDAATGSRITVADIRQFGSALAEQVLGHFKWREALVVTAASLAITTITIAALPSILGNAPAREVLSHADHPVAEIQNITASASILPDNDETADVLIAGLMTTAVASVETAAGAREQAITAPGDEEETRLVAEQAADSPETEESVTVPVNLASNTTLPLPPPLVESQAPDGLVNVQPSPQQDPRSVPVAPAGMAADGTLQTLPQAADEDTVSIRPSEEMQVSVVDPQLSPAEQPAGTDSQAAGTRVNRSSSLQQPQSVTNTPVQAAVAEKVAATDPGQDEIIAELLSRGQQAIDDYRLLTPEDDNAYGYFRAVLKLDPASNDARAGIQEIVDLYVLLTRKAIYRRDNRRAGRYIDRGLSIQPGNRELLALKYGIGRNPVSASARTVASSPTPTATGARDVPAAQGSVSAREQALHESMMSRITTFFNNRKAEAERGEVKIPAGWDG
jgi:type II secretory pathway predicted ATPase ExeA